MENLTSLRSLDVSGGPTGTGRPTSPLQGDAERDFEADLTRARRAERRDERRERADGTREQRTQDRREERVDERREAATERRERAEGTAPRVDPASAGATADGEGEVSAAPDAPQDASRIESGRSARGAATPDRGARAAAETQPSPIPGWTPPFAPAPAAPTQPLSAAQVPGTAVDAEPAALASAPQQRATQDDGEPEGDPEPPRRAEPVARREAPDAPRAPERAGPAAEPAAGEARASGAPRVVEGARAEAPAAPPPAPPAPAQATEHAAAILRQVRLHLSGGAREAVLQLEPARLGRLSIRLELRRGATRAEVVVEEREAFEALSRHEPELRAALADAGFAGVEVELRHAGEGAPRALFAAPRSVRNELPRAPLARELTARLDRDAGVDTWA